MDRGGGLAPTTWSFRPKEVRVIMRCTRITTTTAIKRPLMDRRVEDPRQAVIHRQVAGLRHGRAGIAEGESFTSTLAKLVPRKLIIREVMISLTP